MRGTTIGLRIYKQKTNPMINNRLEALEFSLFGITTINFKNFIKKEEFR